MSIPRAPKAPGVWCRYGTRVPRYLIALLVALAAFPGEAVGQALLDDRVITLTSAADIAARRQILIDFIWGADGFPTGLPSHVEIDDLSPVQGMAGFARVDTLVITMGGGHTGYAHHFIPTQPTNRLVVVALGHIPSFEDDPPFLPGLADGVERTVGTLLQKGYAVLVVYMIHTAQFTTRLSVDDYSSHWLLFDNPPPTGSPLRYFLEPVAVALNYLKTCADRDGFPKYAQYDMVGLSGGGWLTTVYAALDPTILISIPVAGTLPLYLRSPIEGDPEQLHPPFYSLAGYPDLYVMGAQGVGRAQIQVLNRYDTAAFGQYNVRPSPQTFDADVRGYEWAVQSAVGRAGAGHFRVVIDEAERNHSITANTLYSTILPALRPGVVLTSSSGLPVRAGTSLVWTANVTGGVGPHEFQFWLYRPADGWRIVQDYTPVNTFSWTPAATGRHALQVWVRTRGTTIPYQGYASSNYFDVTNALPISGLRLTPGITPPLTAGRPMTWTASASGGVGPLQYAFRLYDPGTGWQTLQDYSSRQTLTWRPSVAGTYAVEVSVRSTGSPAAAEGSASTGLFSVLPVAPAVTGVKTSLPLPLPTGVPVVWTAEAAASAPLEYQYWLFSPWEGWTITKPYGPARDWTWTPSLPGRYALQVWVRRVGTSADYDAWFGTGFFDVSPQPVRLVSFSVNQTLPVATGTPITWSAHATGGTGPLHYQCWLYDRTHGSWTIIRDWSPEPQCTWTPAPGDFGVRALQVWVRSSTSAAAYDTYAATGLFLITP